MTAVEREQRLRDAARRYLSGEIDYMTFTMLRRSIDWRYFGAPPGGSE